MNLGPPDADPRRERFTLLAGDLIEPLRRYVHRRTDPATADDVLGEVLVVLWRRFEEVPEAELRPWAYGVARHTLANAERSARRQRRVAARIARLDPPPLATASAPDLPDVDLALAALGEVDREIVRLWAWEELAPREIALVLGMTPNAVSLRLHRAKTRLARQLRQNGTAPGHMSSEGRTT